MVRAVVISGSLGAGKTRVMGELHDLLVGAGRRSAHIDLDQLCQAEPAPPDDRFNDRLAFANLAAVWPNYEALGLDHLVLARVVESAQDRDRYRQALGGSAVTVVRLMVSSATRRRRLAERMPPGGWLDRHLARTDELDATLGSLGVEDFAVDNDLRPARETAQEIRRLLAW